nr:MAG TPA: hypothetical protein [Caudoviricetes sp.]
MGREILSKGSRPPARLKYQEGLGAGSPVVIEVESEEYGIQ